MYSNIYTSKNDYSTIPESIRDERLFVMFKLVPKANGKFDKIPQQTNGHNASSTDPQTWCSYYEALEAYQTGEFDGIGLILASPLCCCVFLRNPITDPAGKRSGFLRESDQESWGKAITVLGRKAITGTWRAGMVIEIAGIVNEP